MSDDVYVEYGCLAVHRHENKPVYIYLPLHTPHIHTHTTYTHTTSLSTCTFLPLRDILRREESCVVICRY